MKITGQIARQLKEIYFGGSMAGSSMKQHISDLDFRTATAKIGDLNTIAALVFHTNYYVAAIIKVLQGGPLDAHDKFSYDIPPIKSETDWVNLRDKSFSDAEKFAGLIEDLPDEKLYENFLDGKYGTIYRNLTGCIEHINYHLGQIALMKKLISQK
jgi:uncharacterized damage-inducible protein DinB